MIQLTHTEAVPKFRWFFYFFVLLIAFRVLYYWQSDGFSIERIHNSFPREGNELTPLTQIEQIRLKNICAQPFIYLGKGSQAYAFQSQDGQYVLKLFKCYHLKPIPWLENLPLFGFLDKYRNEQLERRQKKLRNTLKSYQVAHTIIPEECGLLFLQIVPASNYHQPISLTDKIGRRYTIDLSQYGYAIQKKADLIFPTLKQWIVENNFNDAKLFLDSLIELIIKRSLKGVQDQDPDLHKNAGILNKKALFIDVGSFHTNEHVKKPEVYINDIQKITRRLSTWLNTQSPELKSYLENEIDELTTEKE